MVEQLGKTVPPSAKPEEGTEGLGLKPRGSVCEGYESVTHFVGNSFSFGMTRISPAVVVKDQTGC